MLPATKDDIRWHEWRQEFFATRNLRDQGGGHLQRVLRMAPGLISDGSIAYPLIEK